MKKQKTARVHRFREMVAVHFTDTETLYLSPDLARQLAAELTRYALDCNSVAFSRSEIGTTNVGEPGPCVGCGERPGNASPSSNLCGPCLLGH
jgi:hypothetical protein